MRKTKFSKLLILILVVTLAFSVLALTACSTPEGHTNNSSKTDIENDDRPIKNGDFTYANGTDYPRSPISWSGSLGGSGKWEPEGGMDALKTGIINLGEDYDYNKQIWGAPVKPEKHPGKDVDDNILMIYASKPSSYSYVSDSFTIKPNEYYKVSLWVNTSTDLSGEMDGNTPKDGTDFGAYISVSGGNVNANWLDVKTGGKWKEFQVFIEGGNSNNTVKVTLGLGRGDNGQRHLTQGHIYFDDVILETITKEQFDNAKSNHTPTGVDGDEAFTHKDSFKFSNADFTNYDRFYTSIPSYPFAWNDGVGGVDDDRASLIPSDDRPSVIKGIVQLDDKNFNDYKSSYGFPEGFTTQDLVRQGANDTNALMLYTNKKYSVNYVASSSITIEKGKIYRLGAFVRTFNTIDKETAKGTILLYNDNEEYRISFDNKNVYITDPITKDVKTVPHAADAWHEVVFYIRGNNTHDVTYKLMFALGTDGKSKQENWTCGHALIDDISISSVNVDSTVPTTTLATGWAKAIDSKYDSENNFALDLNKKESNTLVNNFPNGNFMDGTNPIEGLNIPAGYEIVKKDTDVKFNGSINVIDATKDIALPFEVIYKFGDNLTTPNFQLANKVLEFASNEGTTIGIKQIADKNLIAKMNKQYRLAFWVKTVDIDKNSGLYIKMNILDKEDKVKDTKVIKANSKDISKDAKNFENQWQEVVFYISGDSNDDIKFNIELQYGDGTLFEGKLAKGKAYVYNINYQQIDNNAYTNASTNTIVTKVDLSASDSSSETITNANFNKYKTSTSTFDEEDGKLKKFADPQGWSVANDDIPEDVLKETTTDADGKETKVNKKVSRGIANIALDDKYKDKEDNKEYPILKRMLDNAVAEDRADRDTYITSVLDTVKAKNLNDDNKNRFALAIYSDKPIINTLKSNYISLAANSYYSISIRVFTMPGTLASVKLTSSSPHEESIDVFSKIELPDDNTGWTEYVFFVKTGLSSASVSLAVSLGSLDLYNSSNKTEGLSSGLVLFDYAAQVKHTEETYELAKDPNNFEIPKERQLEIKFNTDGFATDSYDKLKLNEINGWSKNPNSLNKDISGNHSPVISGVIDWNLFDKNKVWEYDNEGKENDAEISTYVDGKYNDIIEARTKSTTYNEALEAAGKKPQYFGSSVLMIDNLIPAGYSVSNSSSKTLSKSEQYYKVSILIYTNLKPNDKDEKLTLSLKIGSRDEDLIEIKGIDTNKEWKEFSFYIKNAEEKAPDLNATLTIKLGSKVTVDEKDTLNAVEGMVLADNFDIVPVTKEVYDAAAKDTLTETATKEYKPDTPIDPDKDKDDTPAPEKPGVDWQMLSWAIPTIILAVMLLVVLGIFLYKKYANPKQHKKFKGDKKKPKKQEIKKPDNFDSFED